MDFKKLTRKLFKKGKDNVALSGPKVDMKGKKFIIYLEGFNDDKAKHFALTKFVTLGKGKSYAELKKMCEKERLPIIIDAVKAENEAKGKVKLYENMGCKVRMKEQAKISGFEVH